MRTLILFAHADPSVLPTYKHALELLDLDADIVLVNAFIPGRLSGAYRDLARSLKKDGAILPGLLKRYIPPRNVHTYDRLALATFSAGYGLAAELLSSPLDVARLDVYVAIDSYHASLERDGTADDAALAPLVAYAIKAREKRCVLKIGHSDVQTPQVGPSAYASTTQVAAEVERLAGGTSGNFSVQAFDLTADAKKEHGLALTKWGPELLAGAVSAVELLARPVPCEERARLKLGEVALALSLDELRLGVGESPAGSNAGKVIEQYFRPARVLSGGALGVLSGDWCAVAACWATFEAAARLGAPVPHLYLGRVRELWQSAWSHGAARAAELVRAGAYHPKPGDLWIGTRSGTAHKPGAPGPADDFGSSGLGHVARFISTPDAEGNFETIDGNHGSAWGRVARSLDDPEFVGVVSYGDATFEVTGAELRALRQLMGGG